MIIAGMPTAMHRSTTTIRRFYAKEKSQTFFWLGIQGVTNIFTRNRDGVSSGEIVQASADAQSCGWDTYTDAQDEFRS